MRPSRSTHVVASLALLTALSLVPQTARAEEPERDATSEREPVVETGAWGVAAGMLVAGGALAAGSSLMVSSREDQVDRRNAGIYLAEAGLTLAPFVAHGVEGEWGRGALFTLPAAAGAGGMIVLLHNQPRAPVFTAKGSDLVYSLLWTVSILGSTAGVVDAAFAGQRASESPTLSASVSNDAFSITLGGQW